MVKEAKISDCGKYRYSLSRIWDESKGLVLWLMLNPSTADAENDDPTIRRCIKFAQDWGYGGILVGNLSAFRATNPKELKTAPVDHYQKDQNAQALTEMYFRSEITVFAWGNPPCELPQCPLIGFDGVSYLKLTNSGQPMHPLYIKADVRPAKFIRKNYFG